MRNVALDFWLISSIGRYPKITAYAFALTIGILLWGASQLHDGAFWPERTPNDLLQGTILLL